MSHPTSSGGAPADPTRTPFVIYESGTARFVENVVYAAANYALEIFAKSSPDEALERIRVETREVGYRLQDVSPVAIWMKYFELFLTQQGEDTPGLAPRLEMFRRMSQRPPQNGCDALCAYILENVDVLSGWATSHLRIFSERDQIFRKDDGLYYKYAENGELYQVIGAKTLRETHLDFVTDQLLRQYGNLRQPLQLFSLFAISRDFEEHQGAYPHSMKAILSEPKFQRIQHQWFLQHWDRTRTVKWRPNSNLCDPDWLASDLLGRLTDTLKIDNWQKRMSPRLEHPKVFDDQYEKQLDCVLDCHLRIGSEEEHLFEFAGRHYRWINGSPEADTIVSVALRKDDDGAKVEEELNRLLTLLAWEHGVSIARRTSGGIIGAKRPLPWTSGTRSGMGLLVEPQWLFRTEAARISGDKWLAMALFREAQNARSVFYEFLNFWKTIEVALPSVANRRSWIDSTVDKLHFERERIAEIRQSNTSVADYLYSDSRCAIAHVDHQPFVNPDNSADYRRLSQDARLVRDLAKIAVEAMT